MKKLKLCLLLFLSVLFGCEKNDSVIESVLGTSFSINLTEISTQKINIDTLKQIITVSTDTFYSTDISAKLKSENKISRIYFKITGPTSTSSQDFQQVSNFQEETSGNSILYKFILPFKILKNELGSYQIEIRSTDILDNNSNAIITPVNVLRITNHPPVILSVSAPDTLTLLLQSQIIRLTATVQDVEGLTDISKVVFNSFKPDNSASGSNPFSMYDDGDEEGMSGDLKAGDGIYSLLIQLSPTAQKGKFRFEFEAYDKSNLKSNIIIHNMVIK